LLKEDILHCAFLYSLSLFSYFIINYISNIFVVKSLNKKIENIKMERRDTNEEK